MGNDTEQPKKLAGSSPKTPSPKQARSSRVWLFAVVIAIALGTAGYCFLQLQRSQQTEAALQTQIVALQQNIDAQQQQVKQDNLRLSNRLQLLDTAQAQQSAQLNAVATNLQTVKQRRSDGTDDYWILKEVEYLLQLANITNHFSQNNALTLALLQTADERLRDLSDPTLLPLRQTLAQEMAQLSAIPSIDKAGLLAALSALDKRAKTLPIATPERLVAPETSQEAAPSSNSKTWRQNLRDSLHVLKQIVVVRHRKQAMEPLLSPKAAQWLGYRIALLLQQAQWAVIHNDDKIYQQSLQQVDDLIQSNFDTTQAITKNMQKEVRALQQKKLTIKRPDVSKSARQLKSVLEKLNRYPAKNKSKKAGGR